MIRLEDFCKQIELLFNIENKDIFREHEYRNIDVNPEILNNSQEIAEYEFKLGLSEYQGFKSRFLSYGFKKDFKLFSNNIEARVNDRGYFDSKPGSTKETIYGFQLFKNKSKVSVYAYFVKKSTLNRSLIEPFAIEIAEKYNVSYFKLTDKSFRLYFENIDVNCEEKVFEFIKARLESFRLDVENKIG